LAKSTKNRSQGKLDKRRVHPNSLANLKHNGRQKGSKDKFTELKDAFLSAFDQLGGVKGLVEWAKRSNDNRGHFYQMITKLLPRDVNIDTPGDLIFYISENYRPKNNTKAEPTQKEQIA